MESLLIILGIANGVIIFVCTICGSIVMLLGNGHGESIDIFRVHKNLYKSLRTEYNLNKIGSIIPLIFITPFFIPAMCMSLIYAAIILIWIGVSAGYCKLFKTKENEYIDRKTS